MVSGNQPCKKLYDSLNELSQEGKSFHRTTYQASFERKNTLKEIFE